jgi:F0F1-type ATP synthase delta subunit
LKKQLKECKESFTLKKMKKNKKLDKIIAGALTASIKGDSLDHSKVKNFVQNFKKLGLEDAVYALNAYKKGLMAFEQKHTLTVYAPVEIPPSILKNLTKKVDSRYTINDTQFELTPSLLAGFKFKIGDEVFDSSLRSSLESLKN